MTESAVDLYLKNLESNKVDSVKFIDGNGNLIKSFSEEDIKNMSQEVLEYMMIDVRRLKDFGMADKVLTQLINIKKAFYPAVTLQKSLNVNLFDDQLNKWYTAAKNLNKTEESGEIIEIPNDV